MNPDTIVTAIVTLVTALGLREAIPSLVKHVTGRAAAEKARIQDLMRERDEAEKTADREASRRRKLEESLSQHRRLLIDKGMNPGDLPAWPGPADRA